MISIQELGLSILSDSPKPLYFLGGSEYGVKDKYIDHLAQIYANNVYEYESLSTVLDLFSKKHIIPLQPSLYVIRYDETFISSLNDQIAAKVRKAKIVGTIVCIYEDKKHIAKLDKFLSEYTSIIEPVGTNFIEKYLHSDFPKLDDRSIKVAATVCSNYGHARNICRLMSSANLSVLNSKNEIELSTLFGCNPISNEKEFQQAIAGRNFNKLVMLVSSFDGDPDSILYTILQTMIELEKVVCAKYSNSDLKDFKKYWTVEDVYYMFMHTYSQLEARRSNTSTSAEGSLIYLFGLLTFQRIPSLKAMRYE